MMSDFVVEVLDNQLRKIAEITDLVSVSTVSRATKGGRFILETPDTQVAHLLRDTQGAQINVTDGVTNFLGPVLHWHQRATLDANSFQFEGIDNLARLDWRVTDPEPGNAVPPWQTDAYDTYTGTPVEVIADMVNDRCGATAQPARQFLTVNTPSPSGSSITVKLRFRQTLGELVHELAIAHDVTVSVTLGATGLEFDATPAPTQQNPIGPEMGGLVGWEAGAQAPEANIMICGGQGELTARTFTLRQKATAPRWPWRIESYVEHTEIDNQTDLERAADGHLEEFKEQVFYSADVTAYESDSVRYGRDFMLGDKVPIRINNDETITRVFEEMTNLTGSEKTRKLTVGLPASAGIQLAVGKAKAADIVARRQQGQ